MKKLVMMALGVCLIAGFTTLARAADGGDKKADRETRRAEMLKKYDKNGDGKLDDSERAAMREDLKKQKKKEASDPKKEEKK